jgi:hypothetical protein
MTSNTTTLAPISVGHVRSVKPIANNNNPKHISEWTKYIRLIEEMVYDDMPSMCLVYKDNVTRRYESNIGDSKFEFTFRFQGDHKRRTCTGVYKENGVVLYDKKKKTPKKLFKSIDTFVNDYLFDNPTSPVLMYDV